MAHEAEQGSFSASFVYGIQVNAHDLIQRAKAFSTYSTDAQALNLIISLRRRGVPVLSTLSPPPNDSITTLPLSILLLIRAQLLELHLDATPHLLFAEHVNYFESNEDFPRCLCRKKSRCLCSGARKLVRKRSKILRNPGLWGGDLWLLHDERGCSYCSKVVSERLFFHQEGSSACDPGRCESRCEENTMAQIGRLLHSYGLTISTPFICRQGVSQAWNIRAPIVLPTQVRAPSSPRSTPPPRLPLDTSHSYISSYEHYLHELQRATIFDPSIFTVTPHDNNKFIRLARDFDLDASWPAAEGDGPISGTRFKAGAEIEDALLPVGDAVAGRGELASLKVRPAFMLLQSAIAPLGWGWRHDAEES